MPPDIILFIIALASLIIAGRLVITFITKAATAFGVSEFALAFILLAVATSIPELFVSIASARQGAGELVLAVTLGSNIINATLVIGLAAFLSVGISTTGLKPRRDIFFTASVTLLPLLFLSDGLISSFEGLLLLVAFGYYILLIYRDQQRVSARLAPRLTSGLGNSILALIMLAALIYAADKTVGSAVSIAHTLNIPPFLIGILALALHYLS